jgi:hypothetical protein
MATRAISGAADEVIDGMYFTRAAGQSHGLQVYRRQPAR